MAIRTSYFIALLIGLAISGTFAILDPSTGFYFLNWQMPGATAAFVFWGMFGWSTSAGLIVGWLVNGLLYSVPLFAAIRGIVALKEAATR